MHPLVDSSSAVCEILQDPDVAIFIPFDGMMTAAGRIPAQTKAELSLLAIISWDLINYDIWWQRNNLQVNS